MLQGPRGQLLLGVAIGAIGMLALRSLLAPSGMSAIDTQIRELELPLATVQRDLGQAAADLHKLEGLPAELANLRRNVHELQRQIAAADQATHAQLSAAATTKAAAEVCRTCAPLFHNPAPMGWRLRTLTAGGRAQLDALTARLQSRIADVERVLAEPAQQPAASSWQPPMSRSGHGRFGHGASDWGGAPPRPPPPPHVPFAITPLVGDPPELLAVPPPAAGPAAAGGDVWAGLALCVIWRTPVGAVGCSEPLLTVTRCVCVCPTATRRARSRSPTQSQARSPPSSSSPRPICHGSGLACSQLCCRSGHRRHGVDQRCSSPIRRPVSAHPGDRLSLLISHGAYLASDRLTVGALQGRRPSQFDSIAHHAGAQRLYEPSHTHTHTHTHTISPSTQASTDTRAAPHRMITCWRLAVGGGGRRTAVRCNRGGPGRSVPARVHCDTHSRSHTLQ